MFNPVATYRIQFHKGFTFSDLDVIIPYLVKLGIKTLYASPIFKAVPGSMHGYDITDPLQINPEIGTLAELKAISKKLRNEGISWLQDIVPNHMAFHPDDKWLMNVLENGKNSDYAPCFDILWDNPAFKGQLMVPFLGKPWQQAVADKEIKIGKLGDKFVFDYFGQQYPLNERAVELIKSTSLKKVNTDEALINQIADEQYYRLCFWQETDKQINFRRFFTVNGLICLNMQDENVFDRYHQLIKTLLKENIFQGLRIDHIDGLYDPKTYLQRLRNLAGPDTYIIVEKILERGEKFPTDWPVQGNTGYDFLSDLNNLFTLPQSRQKFTAFYQTIDPAKITLQKSIFEKKRLILYRFMQGELENLNRLFLQLQPKANNPDIKEAIGEILVYCPVYRYYQNAMPLNEAEAAKLESIFQSIEKYKPALTGAVAILRNALLIQPEKSTANYNHEAQHFYMRLMQFAGPLMAKGVEDTLMYTYNRFIEHNEVGDSPEAFGLKPQQFHEAMAARQQFWPLSLNASSTHDTKRGEDVRARLNVLSDMPEQWIEKVKEWQKLNTKLKKANAPDKNDEYFIYQTIAGAYPMPGEDEDDFTNRLQQYIEKALREAKANSDWATPNEEYETAAKQFVAALLDKKGRFMKSFEPFHKNLSDFGIINSLAQTLLKYTCPGTPDLYQGCELWDLSLVDPDNRRPIDYKLREKLNGDAEDWEVLWDNRYNGQIKQQLITRLLKQRAADALLFARGEYIPLTVKGRYKENILAFARHYKNKWCIVAIPLHVASISESAQPADIDWHNTRIILPDGAPLSWHNTLTGDKGYSAEVIPVKDLFKQLPVALLTLQPSKNERSAGVLLHITSLPSAYGVGDIGPQAYAFVDLLYAGRQKYWQLLPVNPIDKAAGFSPYSASSVMAGNTLLISPELLAEAGLLNANDLARREQAPANRVDFTKATTLKQQLFHKAYLNFTRAEHPSKSQFESFIQAEAYWLDDFALYEVLKSKHRGKAWHQWPVEYKKRNKHALDAFIKVNSTAIDEVKWLQFVFAQQWQKLRQYCDEKGITLLGDMPFYASYNSVDVWADPQLFRLDENGNVAGIAGVPPDYFSAEGQLWGMPVYNWDKLKEQHYDCWLKRIKKNLQYFELIRLDHFRAFSAYWEVPGGSKNAINGKWLQGPGADLFDLLQKELGNLPFVAEDLGEIDDAVYNLRDRFKLPGMHVLQFAFDAAMPVSEHIPHNYTRDSVAYTGTHDNNTIRGWYKEADKNTRKQVEVYLDKKIGSKNVHTEMMRLCYSSVAQTVIVPMQDILGLDAKARMNIPSAPEGNWSWRFLPGAFNTSIAEELAALAVRYNR